MRVAFIYLFTQPKLKQCPNNHNPAFSNLIENYISLLTTIVLILKK